MALVHILCLGRPYDPPTIHGYAFSPEGDAEGHWGADVEEADFSKFLIGEEGSPFWVMGGVIPPLGNIGENFAGTPTGQIPPPPPEGEDSANGADAAPPEGEGEPAKEEGEPASGAPSDAAPVDPLADYKAAANKDAVVLMARERLGLVLDPSSKRGDLEAAIADELANRALPVDPATQESAQ